MKRKTAFAVVTAPLGAVYIALKWYPVAFVLACFLLAGLDMMGWLPHGS